MGCANSTVVDGRHSSNVYEVTQWLWQFGRGKPRLGGLNVEETTLRKEASSDALASNKRGLDGRRRCKAEQT